MAKDYSSINRPLTYLSLAIVIFLIIPVVFIIFYSFNHTAYFSFPPKGFSIRWYVNFFTSYSFRHAAFISLGLAFIVTPLSTIMAIAASYGLVRGRFRGATALQGLLLSPIIIPGVVTGMALMTFFEFTRLNWSFLRLVIAMTLISLPFAIRTISANLYGLNETIEEAAINLGANRWTTFIKIVLPQIKPGVIGGMIFIFAMVLEDVSVAIFLIDINTNTLAIQALSYVFNKDDPTIAAMAALLIGLTILLVLIIMKFIGLEKFMSLE